MAVVLLAATSYRVPSPLHAAETTLSSSRQFYAVATDPEWSSVLCVFADQIKRQWRARLEIESDKWRDPILLRLSERTVTNLPAGWLEVVRTDLHLRFQVELRTPPALERERAVALVVGALCAEYANRERVIPRRGDFEPLFIPLWLVEGLTKSLAGSPDDLLAATRRCANSPHPPLAEELITTTSLPADEPERRRFRAAAWVLTESLLSLPNGADKLRKLMCETGAATNALRAFAEVYSWDFPKPVVREKWWSLQLLQRGAAMVPQDFNAAMTSRQLAGALNTKLDVRGESQSGEAVVTVVELFRYAEASWFSQAVQERSAQLLSLRGVAHPVYQPVIDRYLAGLRWLAEHKISRGRSEITKAEKLRASADRQARAIHDYMDQAERAYAPADTGSVGQQLRLLSESEELDLLRRDPISDYLDKFDR